MDFSPGKVLRGLPCALGLAIGAICLSDGAARAATVDLSFGQIVAGSTIPAGSAPWFDLIISDTTTAGTLNFTLQTHFPSSIPNNTQTLTGMSLDIPTAEAGKLTSVTISSSTLANAPAAFVKSTSTSPTNSVFSATQSIDDGANKGGKFDLWLKFPAATVEPGKAGANGETFSLSFVGAAPTASDFASTLSLANGGGTYLGVATLSNALGTGGSGLAYIGTAAVPEPGTWATLTVGLGLLAALAVRRRRPL